MEERGGRGQRRLFERLAQAPGHVAAPKDAVSAKVNGQTADPVRRSDASPSAKAQGYIGNHSRGHMHAHVHICAYFLALRKNHWNYRAHSAT